MKKQPKERPDCKFIRMKACDIARQWLCRDLKNMGLSDEGLEALDLDSCFTEFEYILDELIFDYCEEFTAEYAQDIAWRLGIIPPKPGRGLPKTTFLAKI